MNAAQQAATAFLLPSLCFCFITKKLITVEIPLFFRLSLRGSSSCLIFTWSSCLYIVWLLLSGSRYKFCITGFLWYFYAFSARTSQYAQQFLQKSLISCSTKVNYTLYCCIRLSNLKIHVLPILFSIGCLNLMLMFVD